MTDPTSTQTSTPAPTTHLPDYARIVVGLGQDERSRHVVDRAAQITRAADGMLFVVVAFDPLPRRDQARLASDVPDSRFWQVATLEAAEALLEETLARLEDTGVRTQGVLVEYEPAHALELVALENQAGLVVVGNSGVSTMLGRMFGSPAVQVLRRASCDVLVVAG